MSFGDRITDWGKPGAVKVFTPPQCSICVHLRDRTTWTCDAFPEGIRAEILTGRFDHTNPYPGDNGIRFEMEGDNE